MQDTPQTRRTLTNGAAPRPAAESPPSLEPLAVPVAEACRVSGLSRSELYRRMAAGQVEARKLGRTTLVLMASLRAHLDSLPPATFRPRSRAAQ